MDYGHRAEELFRSGYNCAQAVFIAFAEDRMNTDEAARLASAFGGGLAGMRMTCGAISGMAMAYGMVHGYDVPSDKDLKKAEYEAVSEMINEFEKINGTIICRELLGIERNVRYMSPSDRNEEYYKKRPCAKLCACAARILSLYLDEHKAI